MLADESELFNLRRHAIKLTENTSENKNYKILSWSDLEEELQYARKALGDFADEINFTYCIKSVRKKRSKGSQSQLGELDLDFMIHFI